MIHLENKYTCLQITNNDFCFLDKLYSDSLNFLVNCFVLAKIETIKKMATVHKDDNLFAIYVIVNPDLKVVGSVTCIKRLEVVHILDLLAAEEIWDNCKVMISNVLNVAKAFISYKMEGEPPVSCVKISSIDPVESGFIGLAKDYLEKKNEVLKEIFGEPKSIRCKSYVTLNYALTSNK